jgi:hypothetical protein
MEHFLIEPVYAQSAPNEAIHFRDMDLEIPRGQTIIRRASRPSLRFSPSPRLEFEISEAGWPPIFESDAKLNGQTVHLAVCQQEAGSHSPSKSIWMPVGTSPTPGGNADGQIKTAKFHLFNLPNFRGPENYILGTCSGGWISCGRVSLCHDNWEITIAATEKIAEKVQKLGDCGGYMITHVGEVKRKDGSTFSVADLMSIREQCRYFLSFAMGRRTGLALFIAYDLDGKPVWEDWRSTVMDPGSWTGPSWFDYGASESLSQAFPGFIALWSKPIWQAPLRTAIYWYLQANRGSPYSSSDTGIILAQVAMELLAWTHLVLDKRLKSKGEFKEFTAAEQLSSLAVSLMIPLDLRDEAITVDKRIGGNSKDMSEFIVRMRNNLVHPEKEKGLDSEILINASRVTLEFLELVILALIGYTGCYRSRFETGFPGTVKQVP